MRRRPIKADNPLSGETCNDPGNRGIVLRIAEYMRSLPMNEPATYEELNRVAECDVRENGNRWLVLRAKKLVNQTDGLVFRNEHGVGYIRLASEDGIKFAGEHAMARTRRVARNSRVVLENAVSRGNDVSPPEQKRALQRINALTLVEHLTLPKAVKTMPDKEPEKDDPLKRLKAVLGL